MGMPGDRHLLETERSAGYVMLDELVFVLDTFDAEEGEAQDHSEDEAHDQQHAAGGLCSPDREDHGQTATDEDGCVGGAHSDVQRFTGSAEVAEVFQAVNQVRTEQAAEE